MKLRPYQQKWLKRIFAAEGRVLVVGPTGAGKTVVAAALIRKARKEGKRVLFIAHRRELVNQCVTRLFAAGITEVGVIMAGVPTNPDADVQVASVQTYARRQRDKRFDVVIIDEAHHATAKSYRRVIEDNDGAQLYGLTATPRRLDGKALNDLFDSVAQCDTADKLIKLGALAKVRVWTHPPEDLGDVKRTGGDYDRGELSKRVKPKLIGNAIDHWVKLAECRPAVCFAVNVAHAQRVVDEFTQRGFRAALVVGATPLDKRESALQGLATGEVQVVVTVEVLTEGWDAPHAACCIMLRPTLSETLCLQMMGRCMRPSSRWSHSVVLDHAGNTLLHGMPFSGRDYSEALVPAQRDAVTPHGAINTRVKTCPVCDNCLGFGARECAFCGHIFWRNSPPKEVKGWLRDACRDPRDAAIALHRQGLSRIQIATELGVKYELITRWLVEFTGDHDLRRAPSAIKEEARKMLELGVSQSVIKTRLGLAASTIHRWAVECGHHTGRGDDTETALELSELFSNGASIREAAETIGLTVARVSYLVTKHKLEPAACNASHRSRALSLLAKGTTLLAAADAVRKSRATVMKWAHAAGFRCIGSGSGARWSAPADWSTA